MKNTLVKALLIATVFTACQSTKNVSSSKKRSSTESLNKEASVMWQQTSGEYVALCHQAFNLAKTQLKILIESSDRSRTPIVIMDLDETVLDNSPYNGYLIKNNKSYEKETWNEWVRKSSAELVPGALDFIEYAERRGAAIFYVSNRNMENIEYTLMNLEKRGIATDPNFLLLKNDDNNKSQRRSAATTTGEVLLYIGDNLADFTDEFETEISYLERRNMAENFKDVFGERFIILPNPMYGNWEKALKYNDPLIKENEKDDKLKYLKSF